MTPNDFYLVLVLGFVSSFHCVQMCGPLVLTYSVAANTQFGRSSFLRLHLAYNAGRTLTYMLLGVIAGLAGGATIAGDTLYVGSGNAVLALEPK